MAEKGRNLDLTSFSGSVEPKKSASDAAKGEFLGVQFACCDIYTRIYLNQDQTAYVGHCPRCAKRVQFQVGAGGSDSRFFTAY